MSTSPAPFRALLSIALGALIPIAGPPPSIAADDEVERVPLWDPEVPFPPSLEEIPPLPYATYSYVHRGEAGELQYLHESGLEAHRGVLYAAWSNSRRDESAPDKHIRGRFSADGGRSWSAPVVIAPEAEGDDRREYANLAVFEDRLYLFTTRIHSGWDFADPKLELHVFDEGLEGWKMVGVVCEDSFVATDKPRRLDNGRWILSGMCKVQVDGKRVGKNRIALSEPDDLTRWTVSGIEHPEGMRFPFSTLIVEGREITAIVRNSTDTHAMVSTSEDFGDTWSYAQPTNLPLTGNKNFAGVLSTGQRYLVGCTPAERGDHSRRALTLMLSEPGEKQFSKIWKISRGEAYPMRFEGLGKGPGPSQWSYAKAVEHDGHLHVIYTVNKEDAEMAIIPLETLQH